MEYRTLGRTGLAVSVVGVGTWQYGGEWGREYTRDEVAAIFDEARRQGINLLDTAECYGDHESETLCGAAIARDRDRWVVATKFGYAFHGPFERSERRAPSEVRKQLEDSLRALDTDRIDLYQFHGCLGADDDELIAELERQRDAGKIRHLGLSLGGQDGPWAKRAGELGMETIQLVYNRLEREPEDDILPACERQNLGVLARVPLASGFLSGKYDPDAQFPASDVRSRRDRAQVEATIDEVRRIAREEVPPGTPMAPWALAWCLRHPAVTCVIPGCKSPQQAADNAAAAERVAADHPRACPAPADT